MSVSAFPYGTIAAAAGGDVVTVTGATYYDSSGGTAEAYVQFQTDGTKDAKDDSGTSQRNASTDWVIPNSSAPGLYQIKATLNSGTLSGSSSATGSWLALTSARRWGTIKSTGKGVAAANVTVEIRYNGGSVLDSGVFILQSERF